MKILVGAKLMRGGAHFGNVSAAALAATGLLNVLASDDVLASPP